jgi:hypothetical protein
MRVRCVKVLMKRYVVLSLLNGRMSVMLMYTRPVDCLYVIGLGTRLVFETTRLGTLCHSTKVALI